MNVLVVDWSADDRLNVEGGGQERKKLMDFSDRDSPEKKMD